jgi:hypothetical protein
MEPSLWEVASRSATQEFHIMGNSQSHYFIQKSFFWSLPWAGSIQYIPRHTNSLRSILIFSSHIRLCPPCSLALLLIFPPKSYMHSPSHHAYYMLCLFYTPWVDCYNYIWREYKLWSSLLLNFLQLLIMLSFSLNFLLSTLFSNFLNYSSCYEISFYKMWTYF